MWVRGVGILVVMGITLGGRAAYGQQLPVDLLSALEQGQVWAQFRGAGEAAVTGVVGRGEDGPQQVVIPSGTQFWAQLGAPGGGGYQGGYQGGGFGGGFRGGGGVQGMSSLGSVNIDLSGAQVASVSIPTACTNLGLREPTPADIMVPAPCPDERLAQVAAILDRSAVPHPAAQVAVWAIANDPPAWLIGGYLRRTVSDLDPEAPAKRLALVATAADLLRQAGLEPLCFRMFG